MLKQVQHDWLPLGLLLLAACNRSDDGDIERRRPIACLLPGQGSFQTACTLERIPSPDGPVLVARGPDGGFRRLLVVKDGRGVIAADGAEPVAVKPSGGRGIDVAAGGVVYRLPARIVP